MWHRATVMPIRAFLLPTQLWRLCVLYLETMISVSPFYGVTWWYQHMCYKCRWSSIYSNHAKKMCTIDMSVSVTPVAVLLLWCSSSVLAYPDAIVYRVIYVNSCNGTFNGSCWNGEEEMPCASLELALEGAEYQNSTTAIVEQSQYARHR